MDQLVVLGNVVCWGAVVLVWVAGALYNAVRGPRGAVRGSISPLAVAGFMVCAVVGITSRGFLSAYLSLDLGWARAIGLGLLLASTAFTLWARFALGTMWSVGPRVRGDRRLRTDGPYGVTRHPIYTGLLGMLAGTALFGGAGQWLVLVAIGLIAFEAKIHDEERLLLATFPDYATYRRQVPQLVPGFAWLRRTTSRRPGDP